MIIFIANYTTNYMMSPTLDDIEEQEDDIFRYLCEPPYRVVQNIAKAMAKQQLCVSEDSPFNLQKKSTDIDEAELYRLRERRAAELKQETEEIKQQFELVKGRLAHLNDKDNVQTPITRLDQPAQEERSAPTNESSRATDCQPKQVVDSGVEKIKTKDAELRLRPLTGKADCPNCICDRRSSVCDRCLRFRTSQATTAPIIFESPRSNGSDARKQICRSTSNDDDRPIRPAKDRASRTSEVVDDIVVPNQVYTISRSLNDKRTKLAQAIEELQTMIERVKERDRRLDEDRKLVQQYMQQWKFGPTIGGPLASPRDRTSINNVSKQSHLRRSYESRLDSELARDSRSLMGFQQVTPSRMHQAPKPAIRRSLEQSRRRNLQKSPRALGEHSRSKSFESLKSNTRTSVSTRTSTSNMQRNQSTSNVDLSSAGSNRATNQSPERTNTSKLDTDSDDTNSEIEEVVEFIENDNGSKQCESRPPSARIRSEKPEKASGGPRDSPDPNDSRSDNSEATKVAKMTWIPVFGETEIKQVRPRANTNRKLRVMDTSNQPQKSSLRSSVTSRQSPAMQSDTTSPNREALINASRSKGPQSNQQVRSTNNSIVLNEATKRLRFAQDLLEQEKSDSKSANQLVINRVTPTTTITPPRQVRQQISRQNSNLNSGSGRQPVPISKPTSSSVSNDQSVATKSATPTATLANGYVQRLEQMVSEQQKLLDNLVNQMKEQQRGSPITVQCSSPCCHQQARQSTQSPTHKTNKPQASSTSRSSVIHHLKDRLNKTKARLMKMLEEERERHQQLKQKVDSSLRKQSDLQNENQMLKQSLNKCIDTCLKDISNTFESLGDSLTDSIASLSKQPQTEDEVSSMEGGAAGTNLTSLTNVAQLIAENRHLKKMKSHIETIESQRREIFDELKSEKQKVGRLESQLKQSQTELDRLGEIKQQLESQLEMSIREQRNSIKMQSNSLGSPSDQQDNNLQSSSAQTTQNGKVSGADTDSSSQDQTTTNTKIDSSDSIALYTRFIKSMTPDLDSIMRERKQMLSELDTTRATIEKMISEMAN